MKTIYTTLPIYDSVAKQAFERSRVNKVGHDKPYPIICPRHRLPSLQWLDDGDGALTVSTIHTVDIDGALVNITGYFSSLPLLDNGYFSYAGDTLSVLLDPGVYYLKITMNNAKIYYSDWFQVECVFGNDTGLPPTATYSNKYLILNFNNNCDLGNIYYSGGFEQTLWFESEPVEQEYVLEESGQQNGYGRFVRTFGRQVKRYIVRTKIMPAYMVDVFNRMKLHDTIALTDLVGDTNDVYNLEVEYEWMWEDRYYAVITLTFDYDEAVVVGACCTKI